jgi:hypothetical protein
MQLSVEVYDPDHGFTFASAMGPVKFSTAIDYDLWHHESDRALAISPAYWRGALLSNPFCAARESWDDWEFEDMQDYLESLNRPHPSDAAKEGPRMVVRAVITDTATGRSEVLAILNPMFEVEVLADDSLTCKGQWCSSMSPRWGGDFLEVRLVLHAEPDLGVEGGDLGPDRMYFLQCGEETEFVELQFKMAD